MAKEAIILQVGVKILLKNKEGQFLLLRRAPGKYPDNKGRWDMAGGRINPGSSLIENLKREIKEETGLNFVGEPKLLAAQDILRKGGFHVVRLTYVGDVNEGKILLGDEHDQYKWYSLSELKKLNDCDMYLEELLGRGLFDN